MPPKFSTEIYKLLKIVKILESFPYELYFYLESSRIKTVVCPLFAGIFHTAALAVPLKGACL